MNEGHSAFLQLERLRELVEENGADHARALEQLRSSTVFTTHTPVSAGNEVFDPELVRQNLDAVVERCGLSWPEFAELGKVEPDDAVFGLTPFALRTSAYANGVSELHGAVSREMWHALWPDLPVDEVPIGSITNGVHGRTWISDELEELLGFTAPKFERALELDDDVLWSAHRAAKQRMLAFISRTRGAKGLDPDVLTIGFARRFATYKRAALLLSQPERLARLLGDPDRPVQILLAGKAHPADEGGKDVIRRVVDFARNPAAAGHVVFLEDYEMMLARRLVQGVDVWLNTPRRPMEASGTSGMKAALNGVLNCSILDGWWAEAYTPAVGFAIGDARHPGDRGGAGPRRRGRALRGARGAGRACLLRAGRVRPPDALDRDDAPLDRRARHPVQHEPHGRRVRGAFVFAGASVYGKRPGRDVVATWSQSLNSSRLETEFVQ